MKNLEFIKGGLELIDYVQPLWEKLNNHHKARTEVFSEYYEQLTFEVRKKRFMEENISAVKVDLVRDEKKQVYVGYCITSINKECAGEIESLYIDEDYRKLGIGDILMTSAITWLDSEKVKSKTIVVASGNEQVLDFYKKYGFRPRRTVLEQI